MSREVTALFTHTNILARRFSLCFLLLDSTFQNILYLFYGMELWQCYTKCSVNRLRSSYIRCMKIFFNYPKYYSVTAMLLELGLSLALTHCSITVEFLFCLSHIWACPEINY